MLWCAYSSRACIGNRNTRRKAAARGARQAQAVICSASAAGGGRGGEEDGAQDGDSECGGELLDGFQDTRGGSDLVHAHARQDELEQLSDGGADACADEEEARDEVPGRGGVRTGEDQGESGRAGGDEHNPDVEK